MNVWDAARLGGSVGNRHALGLWHPLHKLSSLAWMPPVSQRKQIYGKKRYVYVLNFPALGLNQAANDRFSVTNDFWWTDTAAETDFTGETTGFARFSTQLFETKSGRRYMNDPLFDLNLGGVYPQNTIGVPGAAGSNGHINGDNNFTMPYIHRRITKIPAGSQMLMRVQNLLQPAPAAQQTINIQIALGGYID